MRIKVFGCDGGIGDPLRTLALLVDDDVLLEAGSGLGELSLEELVRIDHVFLSHSHADHVACLPLLVDAVARRRERPIVVHGIEATLGSLREHVFNWSIWPDYTVLPSPERPALRFAPLKLGETVELDGRRITALPARHAVPTVGFLLDNGRASLAYSADTTSCDELWRVLNGVENLAHVIIETSYDDSQLALTGPAGHLSPTLLAQELAKLERPARVHLAHMKPGLADTIRREVEQLAVPHRPDVLRRGQILEL